jgi:energy-coupling factor transporter ATP-binding protein EcfA2
VHDFQLEELGPRAFEQLAVALARTVTGPALRVYGSGPDGGREATYDGPIDWSPSPACGGARWTGYTVIQAKQCEHPSADPEDNLVWLKKQVRDEFDRWMDENSRRSRFPNNIWFITNVRLSSGDPGGGADQIDRYIEGRLSHNYGTEARPRTLRGRGLHTHAVWHRDTLNAALTVEAGIRQAFPALLTAGDILARLEMMIASQALPGFIDPEQLAGVLLDHAHTTLETQRWVRFDEAGEEDKQSVEKVIVNLPAHNDRGESTDVLRPCLARGDEVLRKTVWLADAPGETPPPRHLVITGAPGNGKSTLARYLTQLYRVRFAERDEISDRHPTVASVIDKTSRSLHRLRLNPPASARWPLRVDLAPMAEAMGPDDGGPTVRRWLCKLINDAAKVDVNPATLDAWLKAWPCLIIFDGLDEVTHMSLRHRVIGEITGLVERADADDADLFVIVTTRPTGYTERLLPEHFAQIDLGYFSGREAEAYGHHITTERFANDPERRDAVLAAFKAAVANPATERLLKTPLQVLILTVIVASSGPLPANRYLLFWTYYGTVFRREAAKRTTYREFFTTYRAEITELHQRVGLLLQIQCEATREIRGRMPRTELRELAKDQLLASGHGIDIANELADRMVEVATKRLVLLAADEDDTVSFDVRSLQELMAGVALIEGGDNQIRANLTATACAPHWRNTWLFAAGRLFDGGDYHRKLVLDIVDQCDTLGQWPGWLYQAAPELAADLLDDGLAATRPNDQRRLIDLTLRCLDGPVPEDTKAIVRGLAAAAANSVEHRLKIRQVLGDSVNTSGARQSVAAALILYGESFGSRLPGLPENMNRYADMWLYKAPSGKKHTVGQLLRDALQQYTGGEDYPGRELVDSALTECEQLVLRRTASGDLWPVSSGKVFNCAGLHEALTDPDASAVLQIALDALEPNDWAARSMLARSYWPVPARWPIGAKLKPISTG